MKTFRMRDLGYDANKRDSSWFDVTADDWCEAVALVIELKRERVSFTQPIAPGSSIYAAYVPSPTGGHTKIGCVQVEKPVSL